MHVAGFVAQVVNKGAEDCAVHVIGVVQIVAVDVGEAVTVVVVVVVVYAKLFAFK